MQPRTPEAIGKAALSAIDRLKATAKATGADAQLLILRYLMQRFLHRVSVGPFSETLVFKGGMMMPLLGAGTRPTEDIDGHSHVALDVEQARALIAAICDTPPTQEDGVVFDGSTIRVDEIRDGVMPGYRATVGASMHPAGGRPALWRIKLDLCFGDVITPEPVLADLPSALKGFDPVRVSVYPWPTVVAEKLHALARHGVSTTRVKDLYDLVLISRAVSMGGRQLSAAVANTFRQWGDTPPGAALDLLCDGFADSKKVLWSRFVARKAANTLDLGEIRDVVAEIAAFASPALEAAARGVELEMDWVPGSGWEASLAVDGPSARVP